jgi:hypothetical protein
VEEVVVANYPTENLGFHLETPNPPPKAEAQSFSLNEFSAYHLVRTPVLPSWPKNKLKE